MKILLVEDDEIISKTLSTTLTSHRYLVDTVADGEAGWDLADAFDYDLILLDVMLPKLDGISLCRRLRDRGNDTPILLLTAQDTSTSKIMGLDAGADDYVVKPCDLDELLARIRALLRRGSNALPPVIEWRHLRLDPSTCEVTYEDHPLALTRKEYSILELFLRNSRRIFSQSVILDLLWSFEESPGENTVRAHVKSLRQKLKKAGAPTDLIETVYGLGYRLRIPVDGEAPVIAAPVASGPDLLNGPPNPDEPLPRSRSQDRDERSSAAQPRSPDRIHVDLFDIWLETRSQILARMAAVRRAYQALQSRSLPDDVRQHAIQNAHLLVGSLGILGLMQGSQAAREIEMVLKRESKLSASDVEAMAEWLKVFDRIVALPTDMPTKTVALNSNQSAFGDRPVMLLVDRDRSLAEGLSDEAENWGFQLEITDDWISAREHLTRVTPAAMVVNLQWPNDAEAGFELLGAVAVARTAVAIALSERNNLSDRVRVARLGGRGFLQKPVTPEQVFATVQRAIAPPVVPVGRMLVVDESTSVLKEIRSLLEPQGMEVALLDNAQKFWTTLGNVQPDLLVLDADLTHFSGIDLCQVVRNEPQWSGIPVLLLANRTDADTVARMFAAGAADYIRKPIVPSELVARMLTCLGQVPRKT
ncbi:MAG: response regulator [Cyanobacteria bacterium P01_D01_bin.123]